MGVRMSIAWPRLCAACAFAIIVALVPGPGVTPARALDAPIAEKKPAAPSAASRKPAKVIPGKTLAPVPPTKPVLSHPAGWPAAPIGGAPANQRDATVSPAPPDKIKSQQQQDLTPQPAETPPEAEEQNFFQRMIRARTRAIESEPDDPGRRQLTEPPDGYRRPTQGSSPDSSQTVDTEAEKSSGIFGAIGALWNGRGLAGKTGGADGAPAAPKPAPDASDGAGLFDKIGGMLPGFLRGSDKK